MGSALRLTETASAPGRSEARRGGLLRIENKQQADPSCRLQQGLQVEIGTSLSSG